MPLTTGPARGRNLHHLLAAAQQKIERIFPGIRDAMVREGAFKVVVVVAGQHRLRLARSWRKAREIGIEFGEPLLATLGGRRTGIERNDGVGAQAPAARPAIQASSRA